MTNSPNAWMTCAGVALREDQARARDVEREAEQREQQQQGREGR